MIIKAYSEKQAKKIFAQQINRDPEQRIIVECVKEPIKIIRGLIKIKGKYEVCVVKENKGNTYIRTKKNSLKDGSVEIKNEIVKIRNPIDDGRYPSIIADDPHLIVLKNGQSQEGVVILTENDYIEIRSKRIDPITRISVVVSEDKMEAKINIYKENGKKFHAKDIARGVQVKLQTDYRIIPSEGVTFSECIQALKDKNIKPELIDYDAINVLVDLPNNSTMTVARGRKPIQGIEAQIKYYFDNSSWEQMQWEQKLETQLIVEAGEVLAVKTMPAVQGKPGMTILGEIIPVKEVEDKPLIAGEGVIILDNGTKAVSLVSGRPVINQGVIRVVPLLVVDKDVDKEIGDINFDGDVLIKGNVMDNRRVVANGSIKILGSIYNSTLISHENIYILGKGIGGRIQAGTMNLINYYYILPKLETMGKELRELLDSFYKSEEKESQKGSILKKALIEKEINEVEKISTLLELQETDSMLKIVEDIKGEIKSINGFYIQKNNNVEKNYNKLIEYIDSIQTFYYSNANISLQYTQNCIIQACGNIIVTGEGSYQSNLFAKNTIAFKQGSSNVRGGVLIAGKQIQAGTIGSSAGIKTYCRVLEESGTVKARLYAGTILNIRGKIMKI